VVILGVIGKVDFTVRHLSSTTTTFPSTWDFSGSQPCIGSGAHQVLFLYSWLAMLLWYIILPVFASYIAV